MSTQPIYTFLVAGLTTLPVGLGLAQSNQRAELEQTQQALAAQAADLDAQQRDVERARADLERARREMEAAARRITRLSSAPQYNRVLLFDRFGPGKIGATIQNAAEGALILAVTPGGAADEAGVMSGDVITSINGVQSMQLGLEPTDVVISTLADLEPGTIVPIEVSRAGETMTFDVEIHEPVAGDLFLRRSLRGPGGEPFDFNVTVPGQPGSENGPNFPRILGDVGKAWVDLPGLFASRWRDMELVTLTEDLGSYFGTDTGLLVVRAPDDAQIGLRDGDVILQIGGRTPTSPEHALRILTSFVPGETLEFTIMRNQRRQSLEYVIPDEAD
jgi:hypothetical protein